MKRIEIKTSDQVVISFDIAGLRDRAFAFMIDFLILFGLLFVISMVNLMVNPQGKYFWYLVVLPLFFFYTVAFEIILGGLTPGKKAMNMRVIKLNGHYASPIDYIIRWLFRWIDIWMSVFVIGSVLINSNRYGQRLGDIDLGRTHLRRGGPYNGLPSHQAPISSVRPRPGGTPSTQIERPFRDREN